MGEVLPAFAQGYGEAGDFAQDDRLRGAGGAATRLLPRLDAGEAGPG
jgi:hypothetical protein